MNRIDEAIRYYRMLSPGDRVVVGLSGGADSVALTHFLKFSFGADIIACHVNHHLRGEESDGDMNFVEALCREWGIPLEIRHADIPALAEERGNGEEEAGRAARYAFFDEVLVQSGGAENRYGAHPFR